MTTYTAKLMDWDVEVDDATGRPVELTGREKFKQDIREVLERDADLESLVGIVDIFSVRAELTRRLQTSLEVYKARQNAIQRVDLDDAERFERIANIQVFPVRDPATGEITNTQLAYRLDVLSARGANSPATVTGVLVR